MTSKKVANFWRGVALPGRIDDALAVLQELSDSYHTNEPGTQIHAIHLEEPDTIWLYALFEDQAALDEHRRQNQANPKYYEFRALLAELEVTHETTPLFAKGLAIGV